MPNEKNVGNTQVEDSDHRGRCVPKTPRTRHASHLADWPSGESVIDTNCSVEHSVGTEYKSRTIRVW